MRSRSPPCAAEITDLEPRPAHAAMMLGSGTLENEKGSVPCEVHGAVPRVRPLASLCSQLYQKRVAVPPRQSNHILRREMNVYGIIPWRRTVGRHRFPQRRDTAPRTPIGQRL